MRVGPVLLSALAVLGAAAPVAAQAGEIVSDTVPFGAPTGRRFHPDLGEARRYLEAEIRPRYAALYPPMDEELSALESSNTTADWILGLGLGLGVPTVGVGIGLAAVVLEDGEDDSLRVLGGTMVVVGLTMIVVSWIVSAVIRPDDDTVRRVFDPVLGPAR